MKKRIQAEKDFHNKAFREGSRKGVDRFYSITQRSQAFYKGFLQSHCLKGTKVLEYGCGLGSYAYFLAKQGSEVTGIDISDFAIEKAKERARLERLEHIHFLNMDAEVLKFKGGTFDLICGTGILHHLNLTKALPEVARVLRPGGVAVFKEPLGHNPWINLYRRLTPHLRTEDEHPLLMKDLNLMRAHFGRVESRFFHLLSLLAFPFRKLPGFPFLLERLDNADRTLFNFLPVTQRFAWIVVLSLSKSRKK